MLEIKVQIAVTAPFPFPAAWIRCARLSKTRETGNDLPATRIRQQVILNLAKNRIRDITGQFLQSSRRHRGFNKYHSVLYTTLW